MAGEPVTVHVPLGERAYDILIGDALLEEAGARFARLFPNRRFGIVTDTEVAREQLPRLVRSLDAAGLNHATVTVPNGEASKSLSRLGEVVEGLLAARLERGDIVVALGGGVIGDLAGFAAAIARRGMSFVQVPTTLLAQVDSSVGGKTGINSPHGKNLIGAFHQPRLVLADLAALSTLPPRQFAAGYAEVVKYGLIDDEAFFFWLEENRRDIVEKVVEIGADIGIAWDGDADRCFFIDGSGEFIAGDFITALLAEAFLLRQPGATVVYDCRASYAVKDTVAKYGGTALMNRVGHAFIKRRMREEDAIFGGEVTGHYYFKDNFYADNGFIPALLILELMSKKGQSLRDLLAPLRERYFISGEINTKVESMAVVDEKIERLAREYAHGHVYRMDGISVEFDDWHFNVRPSNTEPLLRLNLEGLTPEIMEKRRDEVLGLIRG